MTADLLWYRRVQNQLKNSRELDGKLSAFDFGWYHLPCGGVIEKQVSGGVVLYCPKHEVSSAPQTDLSGKWIPY